MYPTIKSKTAIWNSAPTRRQLVAGALSLSALAGVTGSRPAIGQSAAAPEKPTLPVVLNARPGFLQAGGKSKDDIPVWGYNGVTPGPLLRLQKGRELFVQLQNGLAEPTSIHWRGVRVPNAMDGVSGLTQKPVAAGGAFDYRFTPPDAGTFIYHAHPADHLAGQYSRGLLGLLIVDEEQPPTADADVPLVIHDLLIGSDGKLADVGDTFNATHRAGRIGNLVLVNGKAAPMRQIMRPGSRIRLRIANLAPARLIALTFSGATPSVIAIDGQPCALFTPSRNTLPASPGTRLDVMLDLPRTAGKTVSIRLLNWPIQGQETPPPQALFSFVTMGKPAGQRPPISALPRNPSLPEAIRLQDAKRLDLVLAAAGTKLEGSGQFWTINGRTFQQAAESPLLTVRRGQPVSLGFINRTPYPQVMRVHGHAFRLLHLFDDGWDPYWRDSVIVAPGKTVRIAFAADNPGKWRIGSGIMDHAGAGMAGWFKVK